MDINDFPVDKFEIDSTHAWGYQVRLINTSLYAAKLLVMTNSTPGSLHHHANKKDETFICLSGEVLVETGLPGSAGSPADHELPDGKHTLNPGDSLHIPHFTTHRHSAPNGSAVILEVSTHDSENYTFRVDKLACLPKPVKLVQ